ncbi:MAG: glycosyltransferase family 4 protein [Methylohalobius sp.]|nr:glycosyltransferase family 4 protein [Methylohalobius sp.]
MNPPVLIITRNFPPLCGGMERLNWHLADELSRLAKVTLIAPKGAREQAPEALTIEEVALKPLVRFFVEASVRARRINRTQPPKVILAGSGLTAPIALSAARSMDVKAAAYVHGLDLAVNHLVYRFLWLPAIRQLDLVIANSSATAKLAEQVGVPAARITVVPPGVKLPQLSEEKRHHLRQLFRAQYGFGDRPLLLSVGRLTQRKGISHFVRHVLPHIVQEVQDACLVIVGEAPQHALAAEIETTHQILKLARTLGLSDRVRCLGFVPDETLSAAYLAADVHVFPVQATPNDPEGFGMVAIEAAAHGLPTVAYATGGVVDAVADGTSGRLIRPGDTKGFAQAVLEILAKPLEKQKIEAFAAQFSWPKFGDRLARILIG